MQKYEDIITWYKELTDSEKMDEFSALVYSQREDFVGADVSSMELLMDNVNFDYRQPAGHGESIVFFSIETFSPSILDLLVRKGVPVNVTNSKGQTPLEFSEEVLNEQLKIRKEDSRIVQLAKQNIEILKDK